MGCVLRIGAVEYLNTRPLIYQLDQIAPEVELRLEVPSRLADQLAAGQLDVALIPSVEYFSGPGYRIVSDACIACRGEVWSVKLLCRVPPEKIATLALDEGSRTSAALVQILLHQQYGVRPELVPLPLGEDPAEAEADAVLVIGDRAIHTRVDRTWVEVWDLGRRWLQWTGLPFVFAMWVARAGVEPEPVGSWLAQARDRGVAHLDKIARAEAPRVGLSPRRCLSYLRDNLHFYLGPRERQGLQRFRRLVSQYQFVPQEQ